LRYALIEAPGDAAVGIPLLRVCLRLPPPGALTLRLAASSLPVSGSPAESFPQRIKVVAVDLPLDTNAARLSRRDRSLPMELVLATWLLFRASSDLRAGDRLASANSLRRQGARWEFAL
jgi:hypothetical protein